MTDPANNPKSDKPTDAGEIKKQKTFVGFFRESPLVGVDLNLERDRDPGRNLDFLLEE
jgi:hypothetical protein